MIAIAIVFCSGMQSSGKTYHCVGHSSYKSDKYLDGKENIQQDTSCLLPTNSRTKFTLMPKMSVQSNWYNPEIFAWPEKNWSEEPNKFQSNDYPHTQDLNHAMSQNTARSQTPEIKYEIESLENAQSTPPITEEPKLLKQHWEDVKMISNLLWNKWLVAVMPNLLMREKWNNYSSLLAVGDVVVTIDPSIANSWRLGIIEKVVLGSQQQVRQVNIRLGKNKSVDITKLKSKKSITQEYLNENTTIVTRPAIAVAKVDLMP